MSSKERIVGKIAILSAACAFSLCVATSSQVRADETTNALLDLLKAKGAISQAEYDQIKAHQQAEAKGAAQKLQAAETRAREAEARAREVEAKAKSTDAAAQANTAQSSANTAAQATAQSQPATNAATQATAQSQPTGAVTEAQTRELALSAADMPVPSKMPTKSPVEYVTVLPTCVGIRVGEVDICTKGDLSFFGVEDLPERTPTVINGGLTTAGQHDSNAIRGGLLPSSLQFSLSTHQMGMDIEVYFGMYVGGNNANWGAFGANNGGSPFSLGTSGIDFRQVFGKIGTPTMGTFKIGRDIGVFGSDAILNDLTLLGVGSPGSNLAPANTSLGRIGVGYIYADFLPQVTYISPTVNGFTLTAAAVTPYDEIAFSGDPESGSMTGHDTPMGQGKISYVNAFTPDTKLTLSTSGVVQKQQADCLNGSSCSYMTSSTQTTAWAVDGFGMLDIYGWNFVAYGYTGKGVGTTGLFFDGVDIFGDPRKSYGGYLQGSYTFNKVFTVGGSWGASYLDTANSTDAAIEAYNCYNASTCLVHENSSWIGFARYKLTKWVNLQAEYISTTAKSVDYYGFHNTNRDNTVAVGTTFFW